MIGRLSNFCYLRISAGMVFSLSLAYVLWPEQGVELRFAEALGCATLAMIWIFLELFTIERRSTEHDAQLMSKIRTVINDDMISNLYDHDHSQDIHVNFTLRVNQVASWRGPDYQFDDWLLQRRWSKLSGRIKVLAKLYGAVLVNTERPEMLTPWLLGFSRQQQPSHVHEEVNSLNNCARDVLNHYHKFIIFSRKRIPVSAATPEKESPQMFGNYEPSRLLIPES